VRKPRDFRPEQLYAVTQRGNGGQWIYRDPGGLPAGPQLHAQVHRHAQRSHPWLLLSAQPQSIESINRGRQKGRVPGARIGSPDSAIPLSVGGAEEQAWPYVAAIRNDQSHSFERFLPDHAPLGSWTEVPLEEVERVARGSDLPERRFRVAFDD